MQGPLYREIRAKREVNCLRQLNSAARPRSEIHASGMGLWNACGESSSASAEFHHSGALEIVPVFLYFLVDMSTAPLYNTSASRIEPVF